MTEIRSADDLFWRFARLRMQTLAPNGGAIRTERGFVFGQVCAKCGEDEARDSLDEEGRLRLTCAHCEAPWPAEVRFVSRSLVQSSSRPNPTGVLEELEGLSRALGQLSVWEQRLYLTLYLWERVGSYADVAHVANRRFPRRRQGLWTEWKARRTILDARTKLMRTARDQGLLGASAL